MRQAHRYCNARVRGRPVIATPDGRCFDRVGCDNGKGGPANGRPQTEKTG